MENTSFMRVEEVAQELGVSKSYAYKIVQKLNEELKNKGFLTISGRVNKQYFMVLQYIYIPYQCNRLYLSFQYSHCCLHRFEQPRNHRDYIQFLLL